MPDKPPRGVFRDDDERAAIGAEHRRARSHPAIADEPDEPAAPEPSPQEITSPIALVLRDLTLEERTFVALLGGDPDNAGQLGVVAKLATRVNEVKVEERTGNQARADEHLQLTGNGTLIDRVTRIERLIKWLGGLVLSAVLTAVGSFVAVGKGLYERGEREGADAIRIQTLERDTQQLRLDLRDVREDARRHDNRGGWFVPPASKGPP